MTERIIIEIDDHQLDLVLQKLDAVGTISNRLLGGGTGGGGKQPLGRVLPGINRELRVLLGQIPGMRNAMQGYFMLTRGERAYRKFISPDYTRMEGLTAVALTTAASMIILIQRVQQVIKQMKDEEERFMRFVMQARQLTRQEFERDRVLQRYYLKGQP